MALQMKSFGPKNFQFHPRVKKCHFGNFSEWAGMAVPCQVSPQESLTGIEKIFLSWVPMNIYQWNYVNKMNSLYQIRSKMLHGTKVIILVAKKQKKRWPGWDSNSQPSYQKSKVLTITPGILHDKSLICLHFPCIKLYREKLKTLIEFPQCTNAMTDPTSIPSLKSFHFCLG